MNSFSGRTGAFDGDPRVLTITIVGADHRQSSPVAGETIVEINPGYLQLIPQYPQMASRRQSESRIVTDDGRRRLLANPEQFDLILMNTAALARACDEPVVGRVLAACTATSCRRAFTTTPARKRRNDPEDRIRTGCESVISGRRDSPRPRRYPPAQDAVEYRIDRRPVLDPAVPDDARPGRNHIPDQPLVATDGKICVSRRSRLRSRFARAATESASSQTTIGKSGAVTSARRQPPARAPALSTRLFADAAGMKSARRVHAIAQSRSEVAGAASSYLIENAG